VETFFCEPPLEVAGDLAPDARAIPLDGLAAAAGLDLEPFGDRLLRFARGGRPHWLPWHATAACVLYNADLLGTAGLQPPDPDWTWEWARTPG